MDRLSGRPEYDAGRRDGVYGAASQRPPHDIFEDRLFAPADALRLHQQARTWLAEQLAEPFDGKTVVITHHGPSPTCENQAYPVGPMSTAFYSYCDELLGDPVALWIYGHTHACLNTKVNGSRLVANQGGYPHEDVPGFDPGLVIAV